ncbi:MAG: CapA family protein [Bacteroidales bacterium]|jgi:poly-gamma-glutamate synthesis protein (capsule biosynthesis protein)|nr:CapA family protein [Bacteroidales bacterium]
MRRANRSFSLAAAFLPCMLVAQQPDTVITLLFAGDIMCHEMQLSSALDDSTGSYSFDDVFGYIAPIISEADIAIGNLEVTLGGAPYTGYPAFSAPDALAASCQKAGFDILVTANNHSADRRSTGITRTLKVLDSLGIPHTGTWVSSAARDTLSPLMISENGIRIAIINYTYGTNGIVVNPPPVVAYIDTLRIAGDVIKAREKNADIKIVFVHWGNEYDTLPSPAQKKTAQAIFRAGADMIIGSHPHVIQPMTYLTDSSGVSRPVVWSMGNFVSNQRRRRTDGGAMTRFELTKSNGEVKVTSSGYMLTWVYTPTINGKRQFRILPCSVYEGNPEFFQSPSDYTAMKLFLNDARRLLYESNIGFRELINAGDSWIEVAR